MRHLIMPIVLLLMLFYLVDSYFAHGAYFRMARNAIEDMF